MVAGSGCLGVVPQVSDGGGNRHCLDNHTRRPMQGWDCELFPFPYLLLIVFSLSDFELCYAVAIDEQIHFVTRRVPAIPGYASFPDVGL
jgi:hypothetical protein